MWSSMSESTSLSSESFGLANTAYPTLRNASTHGRTTSALPGTMLVKTVASGSIWTAVSDVVEMSSTSLSPSRASSSSIALSSALSSPTDRS
ncbi:Uncharacterised protein [Mycobacteroides abscessus subsp. abscessus]|nr:Uncharacterised protein [Mycobacteroides abscessus subsp. abscessus]